MKKKTIQIKKIKSRIKAKIMDPSPAPQSTSKQEKKCSIASIKSSLSPPVNKRAFSKGKKKNHSSVETKLSNDLNDNHNKPPKDKNSAFYKSGNWAKLKSRLVTKLLFQMALFLKTNNDSNIRCFRIFN